MRRNQKNHPKSFVFNIFTAVEKWQVCNPFVFNNLLIRHTPYTPWCNGEDDQVVSTALWGSGGMTKPNRGILTGNDALDG